jgi:competence protein ComEC
MVLNEIINKSSISLKVCLLFVVPFFVGFIWYVEINENNTDKLKVIFFDVGQGDAILIKAPNGNTVLIDGGPNKILLSRIGRSLPFYTRSIDLVINTNPDTDHYAGFIDLAKRYDIGAELRSGTISKTATYGIYAKELIESEVHRVLAIKGMKIILDQKRNIYLEILFPDQDVSNRKSNDGSIVSKLVYEKTSILFQGDATKIIEEYLVKSNPQKLKADILKVGHHGSRTSTTEEYVKAVSPKWAIISAGKENRYGHPHKETLDTLSSYGINILRTMDIGSMVFISDGLIWSQK